MTADDPHEPTQELARAARDGDAPRFGALWARVAPALHAWARLRVKPALRARLDPEDLVQEVCCRAFRDLGRWDEARGPFRAWVFGIANAVLRRALEQLALAPSRRPGALDESTAFLARIPEDATTISRRLAQDDGLAHFLERVGELPEEDRRLLLLRGLEGLAHEDIARELGLSLEGAKKRWQRLRARLEEDPAARALLEAE